MFDISKFKSGKNDHARFARRIGVLKDEGKNTKFIEQTVKDAMANIDSGVHSFVIYGDPQSGKTEMMIALTAKLLDSGYRAIVVLSKDDIQLLQQNLDRFVRSGIDPTPKSFAEVIASDAELANRECVIFCKKNQYDLDKLVSKIGKLNRKVIIDDEADYATPNSKVNSDEKTKINQLVADLCGKEWTYIGVTATPARLDLNNTFENANDRWIYFPSHEEYTGQDVFFPVDLKPPLKYILKLLPDSYDDPKYLREALFRFFINVAHLNLPVNNPETNYCMLIHTSGKRADMKVDYNQVITILDLLQNDQHRDYEKYVRQIWEIAEQRFGASNIADDITGYIVRNISRNKVVVMNSDTDRKNIDFTTATNPASPFTIAIGGNIVSRGVTFKNLLSMFFTRDAKHQIQQDTYIQRARMFGQRNSYLDHFELTIPEKLYADWHRCFVFHRLSLDSSKNGNAPVWLEDKRVRAVTPSGIDRTTVAMDSGEMSFEMFDYGYDIEQIISAQNIKSMAKLKMLQSKLGQALPDYLVRFIERSSEDGNDSLAIHGSADMSNRSDADEKNIQRRRGLIGGADLESAKYPHAVHHIKIFHNKDEKARVFYRYVFDTVRFLRNLKGQ